MIASSGTACAISNAIRSRVIGESFHWAHSCCSHAERFARASSSSAAALPFAVSRAVPDIPASSASARSASVTFGSATMPTSVRCVVPTCVGSVST